MDPDDSSNSPTNQAEDPGGYIITFGNDTGRRLDSVPGSKRWWYVDERRAGVRWYDDIVEAHNRYEEWLSRQPPGLYPVPYESAHGMKIGEMRDKHRYWAVHADRSSNRWYDSFAKANDRFEQHLATIRGPGGFPFPYGYYRDVPIRDVPRDVVLAALRPTNGGEGWHKAMYEDNKRLLDGQYGSSFPGSETICVRSLYHCPRLESFGRMNWYSSSPEWDDVYWFHRSIPTQLIRLVCWIYGLEDIAEYVGYDSYESDAFFIPDNDDEESRDEEQSDEEEQLDAESVAEGDKLYRPNAGCAAGDNAQNSDDLNVPVLPDQEEPKEVPEEVQASGIRELGRKHRALDEEGEAADRNASKRARF